MKPKAIIVSGYFNPLHKGHIELFHNAKSKGDKLFVEGRIKTRKWQGEDGNPRYSTEIHVDEFSFLSNRQKDSSPQESTPPANDEDDLPF